MIIRSTRRPIRLPFRARTAISTTAISSMATPPTARSFSARRWASIRTSTSWMRPSPCASATCSTTSTPRAILHMERMDTQVGPIRVEVIEPLKRLRVVVEDNEHGISADLVDHRTPCADRRAAHHAPQWPAHRAGHHPHDPARPLVGLDQGRRTRDHARRSDDAGHARPSAGACAMSACAIRRCR